LTRERVTGSRVCPGLPVFYPGAWVNILLSEGDSEDVEYGSLYLHDFMKLKLDFLGAD
jgi:hypothetical protein